MESKGKKTKRADSSKPTAKAVKAVLSGGRNFLWLPWRQLDNIERTLHFELEHLDLDPGNAI